MSDPPMPPVSDVAGPVMGALATVIGGALLWLAQRLLGKAAVQQAINAGFVDLMEQNRLELKASREARDALAEELARERTERAAERAEFVGEINQLKAVIRGLERFLREQGLPIPARPSPTEFVFQQAPLADDRD